VVLLVCELVLGTPVLAPVLVAPVGAVVEAEVLGVVEVLDGVLGVVVVVAPALDWVWTVPLGVAVVVVVGWLVVVVVLGARAEAVPLELGVVPGAVALVLPVVEAVPVWVAAPDAVVLLPGVALLGVELAEVAAPLMGAADELLEAQLPVRRTFWPM
jgi:hypothetical protein